MLALACARCQHVQACAPAGATLPRAPKHTHPRAAQSLASAFPGMLDFVAVSYVRCAADVAAARAALEGAGLEAGVAAEINTAAALGRWARARAPAQPCLLHLPCRLLQPQHMLTLINPTNASPRYGEILDESNAVILNRCALHTHAVPPRAPRSARV